MTILSDIRTRDVVTLVKGSANPVLVDDLMAQNGWQGGQGCTWEDSPYDQFLVTFSEGTYGGFLLWGSDEQADQLTSLTGNQPYYKFAIMCTGVWVFMTQTYEKYTWNSRHGIGPPNVLITYGFGQRLRFSNRGYWTTEDEWALSGDPRGSNGFYVGTIAQAPSAANNYYMMIQSQI